MVSEILFTPGGGVLPYMDYLGTCRYGIFFDAFVTVFLEWSIDRVAKLYYLILECENACINECLGLKKGITFHFLSPK